MKSILQLPDGSSISSGNGTDAILWLKLTQCVNSKQELTLGSSCAAMLEANLLLSENIPIAAGDELILYKEDDWGQRHQAGIFVAQQPVQTGRYGRKITAFDRMIYTDRDLTDWLGGLTGWPYTLQQLAEMVCAECGVTLAGEAIPNGDLSVQKFEAADITGREILQWIGEATGRFCRADAQGCLEFAWYTPAGRLTLGPEFASRIGSQYQQGHLTLELGSTAADGDVTLDGPYLSLRDDGSGNVTLVGQEQQYYFMGGLEKAEYTVCPVQRLQIRANSQDVGTQWPKEQGDGNTYVIEGNPLLTAQNADTLLQLARDLCEQLQVLSYTPCKVSIPAGVELQPGQSLEITDSRGESFQMLIMQKEQSGQLDILECTGAQHRSTAVAVNNRYLKALSGKVLELRADVDGLYIKNADAQGRTAQLEVEVESLRGTVSRQEEGMTQLTQLQQDAKSLQLKVQSLEAESGKVVTSTGYSFTDAGLRISKAGQEMESLVDHTGLYVKRDGQTVLQAGSRGVEAVDVTVGNYLIVGQHARFEDFDGGTACFYI